jgi:spermidine synthase
MSLFDAWNLPWPVLRIPEYREMELGGWRLKKFNLIPQRGYFQDWAGEGEMWVLMEGEKSWMSTAWYEVDSQAPHVAAGRGHVVVMGAGMGIAVYNLLARPEVRRVTLVEREQLVLDLLEQAAGMSTWPGHEKLHVVLGDALDFSPDEPVDFLYVDIWPTIGEKQNIEEMQAIQGRVKAAGVSWWGQEIHFLEWLKAHEIPLSLDSYRAWAAELGLPLIEQENPAYVAAVAQVEKSQVYQNFLADPLRSGKRSWGESMLEAWTHAAFSKQVGTTYTLEHPEWGGIPLELVSVSDLRETPRQRMYSLIFRGPLEMPFPQGSFPLEHDAMGRAILFLVPVAREADGFRYEAVFNQLVH